MARQLPLAPRSAPRVDRTGLHAHDCACPRCEAGYRPTTRQRFEAEEAQRRVRLAAAAAFAAGVTPDELTKAEQRAAAAAARTKGRLERQAAETAARVKAERELRGRCRAPDDDERAELRKMFGLKPPRKGS